MRTSYDVIIVGAGSMGMSTGYFLAKQGVKVLMLDAFDPPHPFGSHHGDTRLFRHAYTGSPVYTELALRSDALWQQLEKASEEPLLFRSGVLSMGLAASSQLEAKLRRVKDYNLDAELLSAEEISLRWPGIRLTSDYAGLFERQAGYLRSEACLRSFRKLAQSHSAVLLPFTPVKRMEIDRGGAKIHTDNGVFTARNIVLSLGAWFGVLEDFVKLPISPLRKTIAWFEPTAKEDRSFDVSRFPGFIFDGPAGDFYGFPSIDGSGVKIGRHDTGQAWQPGKPFEPFGVHSEDEARLRSALEAFMPGAAGKLLRGTVCKYEMTPDEHFIIDRHPAYPQVWICGGFSGHGFKFASGIGELLSDLIVKGKTTLDIRPFALSRFHHEQDL